MKQQLEVDAGAPRGTALPAHAPAQSQTRATRWPILTRALRSASHFPQLLLDDLVATVFPAECRCCDRPLVRASMVPVCADCLARIVPGTLTTCSRCSEALEADLSFEDIRPLHSDDLLCRECSLAPPPFTRAVAHATYSGELRELIRLFKFERMPAVASVLGRHLAQAVSTLEPELGSTPSLLVVAVPLFRQRERQRGYNQAVLLASEALRHLRRDHPAWTLTAAHSLLERQRSTESSYVLSRRGRRRNLSGAFRLRPKAAALVKDRDVLLLDDIFTSGATARECSRVLLRGGAARVFVATVARAQKLSIVRQQQSPAEYTATWDLNLQHPTASEE